VRKVELMAGLTPPPKVLKGRIATDDEAHQIRKGELPEGNQVMLWYVCMSHGGVVRGKRNKPRGLSERCIRWSQAPISVSREGGADHAKTAKKDGALQRMSHRHGKTDSTCIGRAQSCGAGIY